MAQFVNIFDVDLQSKKPNIFPLNCNAGEGDANGFQVGARVTDGGEYIALGGSCVGKVIRADGATVQLAGTISGNLAYVVLDQTSCAVEGPIQVAVCWVSSSNVTTLAVAYGQVINTQTGNAIQPGTPVPDLTELLAEISAMQTATAAANAAATNALANFAGAFSDSTAYTEGQYVTYTDGYFYRFKKYHAPGAWNASDVKRVTTGGELLSTVDDVHDIIPDFSSYESRTVGNIKYTWTNGKCIIESTDGQPASTIATSRFWTYTSVLPSQLAPGNRYYLDFKANSGAVSFSVFFYGNGEAELWSCEFHSSGIFDVPLLAEGAVLRLTVYQGATLPSGGVTVSECKITKAPTNQDILNNVLYPTGDSTDRTAEIENMLNMAGECKLLAGQYYVGTSNGTSLAGVDMPAESRLIGCGAASEIILRPGDTTPGYAIRANTRTIIRDLAIKGNTTDKSGESDTYPDEEAKPYVNRHGIIWDGTFTADKQLFGNTSGNPSRAVLSGLFISNFTGGGITLNNTGTPITRGISVSDCIIWYCYAGLNIRYYSEFNRFSNIACTNCNIGAINNGGNNVFTNCNFSNNIMGFVINNYEDRSPNQGHGSVSNCIFDHSDGNTGIGISLINVTPGEVFSNCQLFYSQISITGSTGIIFTGLNAGWGPNIDGGHYGETITISGGGLIMFNGCGFRIQPQKFITNNSTVKFVNCYTWTGDPVTVS